MTGRREELLATELERIADELRDGRARLCGYRVDRQDKAASGPESVEETGAIDYSDGWFSFQLEE